MRKSEMAPDEMHPFASLGVRVELLEKIPKEHLVEFVKGVYGAAAKALHPDRGGSAEDFSAMNQAFDSLTAGANLVSMRQEYLDSGGSGKTAKDISSELTRELERANTRIKATAEATLQLLLKSGELLTSTIASCDIRIADTDAFCSLRKPPKTFPEDLIYYVKCLKSGEISIRNSMNKREESVLQNAVILGTCSGTLASDLRDQVEKSTKRGHSVAGDAKMALEGKSKQESKPEIGFEVSSAQLIKRKNLAELSFSCKDKDVGGSLLIAIKSPDTNNHRFFLLGELSKEVTSKYSDPKKLPKIITPL